MCMYIYYICIIVSMQKRDVDGKSYPITDLDRPLGLLEVETPRISRQSAH